MLDNFNRYNIAFDPNYHLVTEDKLFLYKFKEDYNIILKKEKFRRPANYVYFICLSDIDKGEKELTKLEKWKREVIKNKVNLKDQLSLINPYVYNMLRKTVLRDWRHFPEASREFIVCLFQDLVSVFLKTVYFVIIL